MAVARTKTKVVKKIFNKIVIFTMKNLYEVRRKSRCQDRNSLTNMKNKIKSFLVLTLLTGCIAAAQRTRVPKTTPRPATPILTIAAKGDAITVTDKGKNYSFDFLLPKTIAVTSRFVKAQKELFYIRYDYTASARSQSYYLVCYRYYNGKIYLRKFANLKNRHAKWSGTAHFYQDKHVSNWRNIQELMATQGVEDPNDPKNIGIYQERKFKGKMALIHGIQGDLLLTRDERFIALLNAAALKTGI